jgi:hypothetical protein
MDRAAWAAIATSNPFSPLPNQYTRQFLTLRFPFDYNPGKPAQAGGGQAGSASGGGAQASKSESETKNNAGSGRV